MKRVRVIFASSLAALFCIVSCNKPENNNENENNTPPPAPQEEKVVPQPGTYKFVAPPFKGTWEAGDKIYVHGAYAPSAQTITLKAEDISSDGKTASANLDVATEYPCQPDGLYAAWPGDAVKGEDGLMGTATSFTDVYRPLGAAYLDGDTFTFKDASCAITFTVNGDFDSFALASNTREGMRFSELKADCSSADIVLSRTSDGYPFHYGELKSGESVTIYLPGIIRYKKGYALFFGKDGNYTHWYKVSDQTVIKAGDVVALGDITGSISAYDGPAPKMPEMGKMTSTTVAISNLSGLCHSQDYSFLWAVGNDGTLGKVSYEGQLISDVIKIGGDAEGVTLDPETGHLYYAWEPYTVGIVKAPDYNKGEAFFKLHEAIKYSNSGMEGITYYKDGLIYCGTQTGANLFLCDLNAELDEKMYTPIIWVKSLQQMYPGIIDEVGGLYYDPLTDWLWLTDSNYKKISVFTGDAEMLLGSYSVPIGNAESVCVDHKNSCLWVGHDSDGSTSKLFRFEFTGLDDAIIDKE